MNKERIKNLLSVQSSVSQDRGGFDILHEAEGERWWLQWVSLWPLVLPEIPADREEPVPGEEAVRWWTRLKRNWDNIALKESIFSSLHTSTTGEPGEEIYGWLERELPELSQKMWMTMERGSLRSRVSTTNFKKAIYLRKYKPEVMPTLALAIRSIKTANYSLQRVGQRNYYTLLARRLGLLRGRNEPCGPLQNKGDCLIGFLRARDGHYCSFMPL